jgi:hypothetical protein
VWSELEVEATEIAGQALKGLVRLCRWPTLQNLKGPKAHPWSSAVAVQHGPIGIGIMAFLALLAKPVRVRYPLSAVLLDLGGVFYVLVARAMLEI